MAYCNMHCSYTKYVFGLAPRKVLYCPWICTCRDIVRKRRHHAVAFREQPVSVRRVPEIAPFEQLIVKLGVVDPYAPQVQVRLAAEFRRQSREELQLVRVVVQGRSTTRGGKQISRRLVLSLDQEVELFEPVDVQRVFGENTLPKPVAVLGFQFGTTQLTFLKRFSGSISL